MKSVNRKAIFIAALLSSLLFMFQNCSNKFSSAMVQADFTSLNSASCKIPTSNLVGNQKALALQAKLDQIKKVNVSGPLNQGDPVTLKIKNSCAAEDIAALQQYFSFELPDAANLDIKFSYAKAVAAVDMTDEDYSSIIDNSTCLFAIEPYVDAAVSFSLTGTNDALAGSQGHLLSSSENFQFGLKIKEVWDLIYSSSGVAKTGSAVVKVAVIGADSAGIHYSSVHPDLQASVPATGGFNFINNSTTHTLQFSNYKAYPNYYQGHESHIAGLISATPNNTVGVVGISPWRISVLSYITQRDDPGFANAVARAVADGVDIITISAGMPGSSPAFIEEVRKAVNSGVLVVLAAGNNGGNLAFEPQLSTHSIDGVIVVGATEVKGGSLPCFTSRGTGVEIYSPGAESNTGCSYQDAASYLAYSNAQGLYSTGYTWTGTGNPVPAYVRMAGTSMSAPVTAASAALIMAFYKQKSMSYTPGAIENLLKSNSDVIAGTTYKSLNLLKAVNTFAAPPPPPPPTGSNSSLVSAPLSGARFVYGATPTVTANATTISSTSVAKVIFYRNNLKVDEDTSAPYSTTLTNLTEGVHVLKTETISADGVVVATSPEVTIFVDSPVPVCQ